MDEKELENLSELELEELKSITKFCLEVKEICEKAALDYITELNKLIAAMFKAVMVNMPKEELK